MRRWQQQAACRGADPSLLDESEMDARAAALCLSCPVRLECVTEALDRHHTTDAGIWGATTMKQRERISRRRVTLDAAWQETAELVEEAERLAESVDEFVEEIGVAYGVGGAEEGRGR